MRRDGQSTIGHDMQNFNRYLHNHKHINIGSSYTLRIILWRTQTPKFWLKHTFTTCPGLLPFILGNELIAVKQSMAYKFLYITRTVKDIFRVKNDSTYLWNKIYVNKIVNEIGKENIDFKKSLLSWLLLFTIQYTLNIIWEKRRSKLTFSVCFFFA